MKTNIATSCSQSHRLLRYGVSADTADMCYDSGALSLMDYDSAVHERDSRRESYEVIPAWSLSSLLGLLPKEMGIAVGVYPDSDKYTCFTLIDPDIEPIVVDTAIEAVVQMIEQLTNNGYKLNEQ